MGLEILWQGIQMAFGSEVLAIIAMFCIFLYAIHSFKLPMQVFVPTGLLLLFVFAGAGAIPSSPLGGLTAFTTLMWLAIIFVGISAGLLFWNLRKG